MTKICESNCGKDAQLEKGKNTDGSVGIYVQATLCYVSWDITQTAAPRNKNAAVCAVSCQGSPLDIQHQGAVKDGQISTL